MDWWTIIPQLEKVLRQHFPDAQDEVVSRCANKIFEEGALGADLSELAKRDKAPKADIENIEKAAKNLRLAAERLEAVGIHGGGPLLETAKWLQKSIGKGPADLLAVPSDAGPIIAEVLRCMMTMLEDCAARVPSDGGSTTEAIGMVITGGQPQKLAARYSAEVAGEVFAELSGHAPTVSTNSADNKAYGPFLDFVSDVFKAADIEASAEVWARYVVKELAVKKTS
jgi:hypothetical protein